MLKILNLRVEKRMTMKWLLLSAFATILSASTLLIPESATSQSLHITQSIPGETIDGMPVLRGEGCFTSPTDLDGLNSESDLTVIGEIEQSLQEAESSTLRGETNEPFIPTSYVNMSVTKVFKGDANLQGQTIKVGQHVVIQTDKAGKPYVHAFSDAYPFQKGGKYLLFLSRSVDRYSYFPMGNFFGRYNLDGTDTTEERINAPEYQTVRMQVRELFIEE
jgi:hypothetical protein